MLDATAAAWDAAADPLKDELARPEDLELRARGITEIVPITLQGTFLVRHAAAAMVDAFGPSRPGSRWTGIYGALPSVVGFDTIIDRALPA